MKSRGYSLKILVSSNQMNKMSNDIDKNEYNFLLSSSLIVRLMLDLITDYLKNQK